VPYKDLKPEDIDGSTVYVSAMELRQRTGVPRTTMHHHIRTGKLTALRFRNRTYFTPDEANQYQNLVKAGLLG